MKVRWALVIAWALLIEGLLVWPHPPELPAAYSFAGIDKVVHLTLFGVLGVLTARALRPDAPWWAAVVGAVLFGALTELEQHFIPTRSMELGDLLADSTGALIGVALWAVWALRRRELRR